MMRVIKVGGRSQNDPALPGAVAAGCAQGERLCLVHGGGDEVSALQRRMGYEPRFVHGRRVTTPEELAIVRMVLSGTINKRLVAALADAGVAAAGVSGEDGGLLCCNVFGDGSLGAVGTPAGVHTGLLDALLDGGFVPVVSPLGRLAGQGGGCNVNGDDAAAAIAAALGADELLLVADVPGVLDERGARLPLLGVDDATALIASGIATGGMIAKLQAALRCLEQGVARVRIGGVDAIADREAGTALTRAPMPAPRH